MKDMKSMTKKQHYVPQFYMRYWINGESKMLAYFDLKNKRLGHIPPKSVCYGQYQYEIGKFGDEYLCPNMFEDKYGELETKVSNMLQRLFAIMDNNDNFALICSKSERELLRRFVVTMFLRNAHFEMESFLDSVLYDEKLQEFRALMDMLGSGRMDADIVRNIVKNIVVSSDMSQCHGQELGGILYRMLDEFVEALRMSILRSDNYFVFSDVPVHLESRGVYMPLSPKYAIIYGDKTVVQYSNRIYDIPYTYAIKLNQTYLNFVEECPCQYLYAEDNERGRKILEGIKKILL